MADPQNVLTVRFQSAIVAAYGAEHAGVDPLIRASTNPQFGDYQANVAMSLGKLVRQPPRAVAQAIVDKLDAADLCEKVEIAGPGFINLHLRGSFIAAELAAAPDLRSPAPQTVVVDYSSPNVAKEMHVGHLRSTVIGDAIVRVLAAQEHNVKRQNHLGDWGTQFGRVMLGLWYDAVALKRGQRPMLDRWIKAANDASQKGDKQTHDLMLQRQSALIGEMVAWHQQAINEDPDGEKFFLPYLQNAFPDLQRLQDLYTFATSVTGFACAKDHAIDHPHYGRQTLAALPSLIATFVQNPGKERNEQESIAWRKSVGITVEACQRLYKRLGVLLEEADIHGESKYNDALPGVIAALKSRGLLQASEGAQVVFPEGFADRDGKPLPLIVQKSDGGYLYATTDLAAAHYRIEKLHADRIVYVTDSRQAQHFAMVFAVLRMMGWAGEKVKLDYVPFGTVLGADRKPFKTRDGGTVKLAALLEEAEQRAMKVIEAKDSDLTSDERAATARVLGIGAVKYADLATDRIKDYVFDWNRMLAMDGNTAPYLVNAYVRIKSIFRKAGIDAAANTVSPSDIRCDDVAERALAMKLLQYPSIVDAVAQSLEPHRLCNYLYEVASAYHQFYERCPVLTAAAEATKRSRLALCAITARTLRDGLALLGIETVEKM